MPVVTPEGVVMDLPLAGVGSRLSAAVIDGLIQLAIFFGVFWLAIRNWLRLSESGFHLLEALYGVTLFALLFVYPVLFETAWSGRTPGKRVTGLRVLTLNGGPIGFRTSAIRNLIRVIDFLPTLGVVGIVSVAATRRNQRLGDLAAGTIVIIEPTGTRRRKPTGTRRRKPAWLARKEGTPRRKRRGSSLSHVPVLNTVFATGVHPWDLTAVTKQDLGAVRTFLARRESLPPDVRNRLATQFATPLRAKTAGVPAGLGDESFLLQLVAEKDSYR